MCVCVCLVGIILYVYIVRAYSFRPPPRRFSKTYNVDVVWIISDEYQLPEDAES